MPLNRYRRIGLLGSIMNGSGQWPERSEEQAKGCFFWIHRYRQQRLITF
jgi:hypothetical protein